MKSSLRNRIVQSLDLFSDFANLFRFATKTEKYVIVAVLGLISVISAGLPLVVVIYAEISGMIVDRMYYNETRTNVIVLPIFGGGRYLENASFSEKAIALNEDVRSGFYISFIDAFIMIFLISICVYVMNFIAQKQTMRIRKILLKAILSQDMTWFDSQNNLDITTKITNNLDLIKDAIGERLLLANLLISAFVFNLATTMVLGWKLTLIMGGTFAVFNLAVSVFVGRYESRLTETEMESYSKAGSIANEVFSSIRTVMAFGGEEKESQRYAKSLQQAEKSSIRKSFFSGLQSAIIWFFSFMGMAFGMFVGINFMIWEFDLSEDQKIYNTVTILCIVLCLTQNTKLLAFIVPSLDAISSAKGASKGIYKIIDQKRGIDPFCKDGIKVFNFSSNIRFKNVRFEYPTRKFVPVLKDVDFEIANGQTVALVGRSGCGKSTCLHLLQRLYDPTEGFISIDGISINYLNIAFLRSQIGVVGQEPALFSVTIADNIRFGNPEASMEEIVNAAKIANCHNFIEKLPFGYETLLGENGAQMSGGQKQRIAIARAIVRNPKILLLDEATSALDSESERIVQKALDKASEGRTTLIVSHRLSTIRNADQILVFDQGVIVERGTHSELMDLKGVYYNLRVTSQDIDLNDDESSSYDKENEDTIINESTPDGDHQLLSMRRTSLNAILPSDSTMKRILKLSLREWKLMLFGIFGSLFMGGTFPISSIFFANVLEVFQLQDIDKIYRIAVNNTISFLVISIMIGLAALLQTYSFGKVGARIVSLLKHQSFSAALRQEIAWFEAPENSVGALSSKLSKDCANIQGATGIHFAGLLQATFSVIVGIFIGMFVYWKLAIVISIAIPLHFIVAIFDCKYAKSSIIKERKAMENASRIAVEAITNIRTVASLGQEKHVLERFSREIEVAEKEARNSTRLRGFAFSLNLCMHMITYSAAFLYAIPMIINKEIDFVGAILVIEAIVYGCWMMGIVLNNAPNVSLAISSAENIFKLLDRKPKIKDPVIPIDEMDLLGDVSLTDVQFRYPSRPESEVLKKLNLSVPQGKTVALVGPSGCGKSTCIQLLLRLYDPEAGTVKLDGTSVQDVSLGRLRSNLGLVSQEPVLFDRTIAENIAYGDNSRQVSMEEIIEAAKEAQIHSQFVCKLPLGYETPLGSRGTKLSGGQKQRIAIARALIRKPKILLLDEATSALDAESEKTVQNALDKASENRTCIVIAHRLSTIRNADLICVIDRGQIAEMGSHDELVNLGGIYYKLYQSQC